MSTERPASPPLNGRRAEAARNNRTILDAARAVFTDDPGAPIAAVAARAGVGIGALYRRYASKDVLLQHLALDGLNRYIAAVEAALIDEGELWAAFARFMRVALDAGTGSLTLRFAGNFTSTEELQQASIRGYTATQHLLDRAQAAGIIRADLTVTDLALLFEQFQAIRVGDHERTMQLRHRALTLSLDALRCPDPSPLPGPAPRWEELQQRYGG
jgi:AcrR family transcriptional regulator